MEFWSTPRDPKRIERICKLLVDAWSKYPDQRLGQFLLNYMFGSYGKDTHIFHKEDDVIETLLKEVIEKFDAFEKLSDAEKIKEIELRRKKILEED